MFLTNAIINLHSLIRLYNFENIDKHFTIIFVVSKRFRENECGQVTSQFAKEDGLKYRLIRVS